MDGAKSRQRLAGLWSRNCATDIILGRRHPRERLIEDEVIAASGATRHSVRRAFDELERLGLAERLPNRGVRVRDYTATEVEHLYEIRDCLERQAALKFDQPADPALVAELRDLADAPRQRLARGRFRRDLRPQQRVSPLPLRRGGQSAAGAGDRALHDRDPADPDPGLPDAEASRNRRRRTCRDGRSGRRRRRRRAGRLRVECISRGQSRPISPAFPPSGSSPAGDGAAPGPMPISTRPWPWR